MLRLINKILGDPNKKAIKKLQPTVEKINKIEEEYQQTIKDQNAVLAKTTEFKERIKNGESVDSLIPEAFALVKTACRHILGQKWEVRGKEVEWNMVPFDVQLVGALVLNQGNIAEMKTGEGKTLVCTMPIFLNALTGKGVFVVTVNSYLASRDAEWMGGLFNYLGLSVGVTDTGMSHADKKAAYSCDVTYGTNNEYGFDYLRDNMTTNPEHIVQRNLHYAIIDEVDSILIDEARTPLVISAPAEESTSKYIKYHDLVKGLEKGKHYDVDEKSKNASLTEEGIAKMEELLGVENIYTESGFAEVHHIEQALRSTNCYEKDSDYIVQEGQVIIIDEFTGRLMAGRRYGQGLHQAIEAKEGVEVKRESKTLATITFQNYFRMFDKLSGMTGTAETEAEEFYQIYGLDTLVIPTNKPLARIDSSDAVYKNQKGKYLATVKKIKELHEKGQPVLVGTISVERSELIHKMLTQEGVPHNVLNAKNHEREAEIITKAGEKGGVTIATNMAGRGTDIKLAEGVKELGGLFVLGTERHESRRIDNQLRGRSGRQGDPGASQFFVSMEDEIMRLFGGEKIQNMMTMLKVPEDMPIENGIITRSIEGAQKKVEGRNFDIRKHLVEYDDVLNVHREIMYRKRKRFLLEDDVKAVIEDTIKEVAEGIIMNQTEARPQKEWNYKEIHEAITAIYKADMPLPQAELEAFKEQPALIQKVQKYLLEGYKQRESTLSDPKIMRSIEKAVFLRSIDILWKEHIDSMTMLRENVAFSGYAQKNPLMEYKGQGFEMFNDLLAKIDTNSVNTLFKINLENVVAQDILQKNEDRRVHTNASQIESNITGKRSDNPVVVKNSAASHNDQHEKVGRNDACPCGSKKKFKKCCGKNQ